MATRRSYTRRIPTGNNNEESHHVAPKSRRGFDGILYFDGAAQPNPGIAGAGWILRNKEGKATLQQGGLRINLNGEDRRVTSNQAEYVALIKGLQACIHSGLKKIEVRGDSQLIIRQMTGEYKVRDDTLQALHDLAHSEVQKFDEIRFLYVPRDRNQYADGLAKSFLTSATSELVLTNDIKAEVEPKTRVKKVSKNARVKKQMQDYTQQWLQALTKAVGDVEYHVELLHVLQQVPEEGQKMPPTMPPPVRLGATAAAPNVPHNAKSILEMTNAFSALLLSDDEDDDNNDRIVVKKEGKKKKASASSDAVGMQVRYLAIRTQCGLAEAYRMEANEQETHRAWMEVASHWSEAFDLLNRSVIQMDPWLALALQDELNGADAIATHQDDLPSQRRRKVPASASASASTATVTSPKNTVTDGHDLEQLQILLDNMQLVKEDTERERDFALERMTSELDRIHNKLNPLRQDRDVVKNRMGNERWKSNPAPKMDYAERMIALAEEQRALEKAISSVEMLMLAS